jgi:hypothetical protein
MKANDLDLVHDVWECVRLRSRDADSIRERERERERGREGGKETREDIGLLRLACFLARLDARR